MLEARPRRGELCLWNPDSEDYVSLDLLTVTPALHEAWDSREAIEWEGTTLRVVSWSGLLAMKALRSSGQDRDDIARLETRDEA